ncbi:hypothetical protein OQJ19_01390 [Fluoribacter gormanii]|uniref:Uncharacterized protein n=1 Tax=Fluoribacter gormanii TaxID=464 RepID=A0A377GIV8_9GAMM|nr:hypothetical protein [Fluoribacter gormanii]KTD01307.1 hypothetical protein Lgor_2373 [Fluoribacter gormanii]MCW8444134.1 hypothetical protein [Fluoribacter gormanii]MCW8469315.1 hypothetical protein [Fluoribacter gormanii]SIR81404.1 hypothetical protein SAMN05421777_12629 [Fluoribacter gormanii]STO24302.1 Uncharacterised protein [Fluoribacter gormanii]
MRNIFQWLIEFLDVIVGVEEEKSNKHCMNAYEAQEKYNAGLIPMREYNKEFERKDRF